ncbi:MAG: hypothetical protein H7A06_05615 [Pseudomonadales bacterium]|nr:hypothetical protein [Pseudomonadales bacterium]
MKLNLDRNARIKILLIVFLLIAAPYFAPFAIDFIILADFMGLEALLVLAFAYSKSVSSFVALYFGDVMANMKSTLRLVVELPVFRPRVYLAHATLSSVIVVITCSLFLACLVWLPPVMMSMSYLS